MKKHGFNDIHKHFSGLYSAWPDCHGHAVCHIIYYVQVTMTQMSCDSLGSPTMLHSHVNKFNSIWLRADLY